MCYNVSLLLLIDDETLSQKLSVVDLLSKQ